MEFDISRVYSSVNADELKVGSKVVVANTIGNLKELVEQNMIELSDLTRIGNVYSDRRFIVNEDTDRVDAYSLAYLVSEPEEKTLKWSDLKIGDVIRSKYIRGITHLIIGIDEDAEQVFFCSGWAGDKDLVEWEKVEE